MALRYKVLSGRSRRYLSRRLFGSKEKIALSFGGSGLMMFYQFGAASKLSESEEFMQRVSVVHGTSGGAVCGSMMISCPDRFYDALDFFTTGKWLQNAKPRHLLAPHRTLLVRAIKELELNTDASLLNGKFVAHVTQFIPKAQNIGIDDFENSDEVIDAIAASCCLSPGGSPYRGQIYYDGGFSDPLPSDPQLPTVSVSILAGSHVDLCPTSSDNQSDDLPILSTTPPGQSPHKFKQYRGPPFLRYPMTIANARALMETVVLTPKRARERFSQGHRDADAFLHKFLSRVDDDSTASVQQKPEIDSTRSNNVSITIKMGK